MNKNCFRALSNSFALVLLKLLVCSVAVGFQLPDSLLLQTMISDPVVLPKLRECSRGETIRIGSQIAKSVVEKGKRIYVSGMTPGQKKWSVDFDYAGDGGCRFFILDLDRNGREDVVFLTANMGSGLESTTLSLLLFEANGLPAVWQTTGAFAWLKGSGYGLVDLNKDKHFEILVPTLSYTDGRLDYPKVVYNLYSINDARVDVVRGRYGQFSFPYGTGADNSSRSSNLSTNSTATRARSILSLKFPSAESGCSSIKAGLDQGGVVIIPKSKECEEGFATPEGFVKGIPTIKIFDWTDGSRSVLVGQHSEAMWLRAQRERLLAKFVGEDCQNSCAPYVGWFGR